MKRKAGQAEAPPPRQRIAFGSFSNDTAGFQTGVG